MSMWGLANPGGAAPAFGTLPPFCMQRGGHALSVRQGDLLTVIGELWAGAGVNQFPLSPDGGAKITLAVTTPGFDRSGGQAIAGNRARALVATRPLRKPHPDNTALAEIDHGDGTRTVRFAPVSYTHLDVYKRQDVDDGGQGHDQCRYLGDAEDQHDQRQRARPRNPGDQQGQADDDGLDKGHADHPLGDGPNGRRG